MGAPTPIAVKICGITEPLQATEIAQMGVNAVGVIGVANSKRFVNEKKRREIFSALKKDHPHIKRVWVIANPSDAELSKGLEGDGTPSVIQLHGAETQEQCQMLSQRYPHVEWWKALQISCKSDLEIVDSLNKKVDAILLDAWDAYQLGGTGKQLPIEWLRSKRITTPWWLAGGICAELIPEILKEIRPSGIDASSRLEVAPGKKDIQKVRDLLEAIKKAEN